MARVKQVVDYAYSQDMYVVLNIHWDGGWLEEHPLYSYQAAVNQKQRNYWTQIANTFHNYDERLLFAGTNEVHANYGTPTTENITVQQSFNQTFVNAVRATGGNNASRTLVVQTLQHESCSTASTIFTLPYDTIASRLMVEVHFYDPLRLHARPERSLSRTGARRIPVQRLLLGPGELCRRSLRARSLQVGEQRRSGASSANTGSRFAPA